MIGNRKSCLRVALFIVFLAHLSAILFQTRIRRGGLLNRLVQDDPKRLPCAAPETRCLPRETA
jgi:hypothetical protein